jgi:hypothetical protein
MYHPVHIGKLSPAQISKLLNGHPVRMKHGTHHVIHVSKEQHKKYHKAKLANKGLNMQFDPYQIDQHQHLRGHGLFSSLKNAAKSAVKQYAPAAIASAKSALQSYVPTQAHSLLDMAADHANSVVAGSGVRRHRRRRVRKPKSEKAEMGGSTYAQRLARRTRNTFAPVQKAFQPVAEAFKPLAHQFAHQAGQAAQQYGKQALANAATSLMSGAGVGRARGRARRGRGLGIQQPFEGGALYPAGYYGP